MHKKRQFDPALGTPPSNSSPRVIDHFRFEMIKETRVVQLDRGVSDPKSASNRGRNVVLVHVSAGPMLAVSQYHDSNWVGLLLNNSSAEKIKVNGTEIEPGQAYLHTSGTDYHLLGRRRDVITVGLRRDRLQEACGALLGIARDELVLPNGLLTIGVRKIAYIKNLALDAIGVRAAARDGAGRTGLPHAIENTLIGEVATVILPFLAGTFPTVDCARSTLENVRRAQDAARCCHDSSLSIADLCAAAGVGASRLHASFVDVYGISPAQYLLHLRLTAARERLLDVENPPRSVKDVALSLGFLESGRFAQRYRQLFDENPSETLLRADHTADGHCHTNSGH